MKPLHVLLFALAAFTSCSRNVTPTISDIEASLESQFKQQWDQKKDESDKRYIKAVHVGKFYQPNGSGSNYVELEILWNNTHLFTSSPIIPLGNSAIGISFEVPYTKQNLSAIVAVKR